MLERAYAAYRRKGDCWRAAMLTWLARQYALIYGNEAAAKGWLHRAESLLEDAAALAAAGAKMMTWRSRSPTF